MKLTKSQFIFRRATNKLNTDKLYIFDDNCDRTSGNGKIPDDSEYSKRFGKTGLHYPSISTEVLRGLPNAYPITTQKHKGCVWEDSDFEEFKRVIDDDFEHIKKACVEKGYKEIIFPFQGILNRTTTKLTYEKVPNIYCYLIKKEIELAKFEP